MRQGGGGSKIPQKMRTGFMDGPVETPLLTYTCVLNATDCILLTKPNLKKFKKFKKIKKMKKVWCSGKYCDRTNNINRQRNYFRVLRMRKIALHSLFSHLMRNFPCTKIFKKCGYVCSGKFDPSVGHQQDVRLFMSD